MVVAAGNFLVSRRCGGDRLDCREEFGTKPGIELDVDRPVGILQLSIPDSHTKSFFDQVRIPLKVNAIPGSR